MLSATVPFLTDVLVWKRKAHPGLQVVSSEPSAAVETVNSFFPGKTMWRGEAQFFVPSVHSLLRQQST
jgi:hypothetical protein